MNERRLLHVTPSFAPGGSQVRAIQLMEHLGPGCRHTVVAVNQDHAAARMLPAGVEVGFVPPPPRGSTLATMRRYTRLLRELRPDLVLTYNWGTIDAAWAAQRLRLPHVHHEDGFGPDETERRLLRRNLFRRWVLRSAPVIVPSALLLDIAQREWHLHHALHLPNGVDLQRFSPGAPSSPPILGAVGGLRPEKDHATLLRAFAAMQRSDCVLRLVGDGPLRAPLEALAEDLGVRARVQFAGAVADPSAEYRAFTVFVLSSRTEQMPLSQLEGMASALPVVATDVGDVRALLPAECRGGIVPKGMADALARALDAALADPQRSRQEGVRNRAHCEQHYELGTCLQRYVDVYARAMQ